MLNDLLNERMSSLKDRIELKLVTQAQVDLAENLFSRMKIWILVTSDGDKTVILTETKKFTFFQNMQVFSIEDVRKQLNLS